MELDRKELLKTAHWAVEGVMGICGFRKIVRSGF